MDTEAHIEGPKWDLVERRSKSRNNADRSHSVEIKLTGFPAYQLKLRDVSWKGAGILIKEGSSILKHLEQGQGLYISYYGTDKTKPEEILTSEIKHITKLNQRPILGHYLIGILILDRHRAP